MVAVEPGNSGNRDEGCWGLCGDLAIAPDHQNVVARPHLSSAGDTDQEESETVLVEYPTIPPTLDR